MNINFSEIDSFCFESDKRTCCQENSADILHKGVIFGHEISSHVAVEVNTISIGLERIK